MVESFGKGGKAEGQPEFAMIINGPGTDFPITQASGVFVAGVVLHLEGKGFAHCALIKGPVNSIRL